MLDTGQVSGARRWEPTPACILAGTGPGGAGGRPDGGACERAGLGFWLCWHGRRMYGIKYYLAVTCHTLSLRDSNAI